MEHMIGKAIDYAGRNDVEAMKSLKRSIEILRSQAMDIEDDVKKEEMPCKKKMKTEVKNWVKEVNDLKPECDDLEAKVSNSKFPLFGDPVGKMQCRVNQLTEQKNSFNGFLLDDFDNNGVPCLPTKLFGNKIMETFKKIWPCLVVDNISSIGIWGMGGVGKTTLAKHIKFELERENYRVYWVTVSQEFSITSLQDKIANVLGISLSNRDEEHMRANILRAAFEKMEKSVFIFDDVWKEFHLEDVGIAVAANKCRLIWTTRSLQACDRMRCQRRFKVTTLDEQESWDLFRHTLGHETKLSAEVGLIAKSVANRCAGLPLGIVTTASSMRGVTHIREWNIVLEQLKSSSDGHHEMEDEVFPILEWSFNRLRGCERPCFLYCCLYPEDHEIEREQLIDLFIFAELIPRRDTMELERSDGHRILNKLVKVCLLDEADDECVRMHDLIRDMALRITSGRYNSKNTQGVPRLLVKSNIKKSNHLLVEKEELKDDLVAVSLMPRPYDRFGGILEIPPFISPNCRNLSTLIINRADVTEIPDSFLQHLCGLKVLNLDGCKDLRALPNCISNMVNLTALLLDSCQGLESVPPLGKLKKLRILSLFKTKVDNVPQGLEELVNLERLYMGGSEWRGSTLPEGTFSKLYRLQHLVSPAAVHISDLQVLNELQFYMERLTYDQFAKIRWRPTHYEIYVIESSDKCFPFFDYRFNDAPALMREIRSENKLNFRGCKFQKGLNGVLPPENLHWLDLDSCSGLSDVFFHRWIDRSKDLYHLRLEDLDELKFVLNLSSPDDDAGALRNLRVLDMGRLPNLVGLVNTGRVSGGSLIPPGTFSSLERLYVDGCDRLKKLFSVQLVQQCLQNLKHLEVHWCDQVEAIVADNDDDDLNGGGGEAIISQSYSSVPIASTSQQLLLPKLKVLILSGLRKLENVCGPTIMIGGDEPTRFELHRCPKLKRLPSFSSAEITYEIKGRKKWWNSLEWNNPSDKDAVQPFFKDEGPMIAKMLEIIRTLKDEREKKDGVGTDGETRKKRDSEGEEDSDIDTNDKDTHLIP